MFRKRIALLLTALQLVSLPTTLLTPILADKINMRIPILGFGVCYAIGMGSFYFVGAGTFAMWVSIVILAIGMGSGFSACIFLFSKKTSGAGETAAISGFAQCGGYVFSAIGPVFMGWTYDVSGSWNTAIIFGFLVSVAMMVFAALSSNSSNVFEK